MLEGKHSTEKENTVLKGKRSTEKVNNSTDMVNTVREGKYNAGR